MVGWGGGPCDFCVSPSPFGLDFGTLDFGTSDSGLTTISTSEMRESTSEMITPAQSDHGSPRQHSVSSRSPKMLTRKV